MEVEGHGLRATPLLCKQGCTRVARGGLTLVQRGGPSRRRQEGSGRAPSSGEGGACFLPSPPRSKAPPAALSSLGSSFLTGSDLWGGGFVVPISALKTCLMNERNNVIKNLKVGWGESFPSLGLVPKHPEGHICIQIIDILITIIGIDLLSRSPKDL